MNNLILKSALVLLVAGAVSCNGNYRFLISPLPSHGVVVRPPSPGGLYIWIEGDWFWNGNSYTWRNGYWTLPRDGYMWKPGKWIKRKSGWYWQKGQWKR